LRLEHVDAEWQALFGMSLREAEGTTGIETVHPDDHRVAAIAGIDLLGGSTLNLRLRIRLHGRFKLCRVVVQPCFDAEGRFAGAHGFTWQTTEPTHAPKPEPTAHAQEQRIIPVQFRL
jgi:hypothetical protein